MAERPRSTRIVRGILILLALLVVALRWIDTGDRGMNNALTMLVLFVATSVVVVWWTFLSRRPWTTRLAGLGGLVAALLVFNLLFEFVGFRGEMVPIFRWRLAAPTETLVDVVGSGVTADLTTTTPYDFAGFLGSNRDLRIDNVRLARDWDRLPDLLWRQEIGAGWGAFAVVNGYASTIEERGGRQMVTLYAVEDGELIWRFDLGEGFFHMLGGTGPRSTPTIDGGIVYAMGAHGRLVALDGATGELLWDRDLLADYGITAEEEARTVAYGRPTSPLIVGNRVVVGVGGSEARRVSVAAYDKVSGELLWEGGARQVSMASPAHATLSGREQILLVNENWVTGHDPETGAELWAFEWPGITAADSNVSQAVPVAPDQVFISKGYGGGAALHRLVADPGGELTPTEIWSSASVLRTKMTNVAILDGYVYGLSEGILECVELATGERAWKAGRYHHGQILLVGDLLLVLTEDGEVVMVEATADRRNNVLGRFQAIEGHTWNNLALYGDVLLVRNGEEAAAYRLPLDNMVIRDAG